MLERFCSPAPGLIREQAQEKQDRRHLSKSAFETVLSGSDCVGRPVKDAVLGNLRLETLREAVDGLGGQGRDLVELRYGSGLTMEEIGTIYGVSKAAVSLDGSWRLCRLEPSRPPLQGKRLKKLHERLRGSVK